MAERTEIAVRVAPELEQSLKRLAEAEERSLADYIGSVLEEHVAARRPAVGTPSEAAGTRRGRSSSRSSSE